VAAATNAQQLGDLITTASGVSEKCSTGDVKFDVANTARGYDITAERKAELGRLRATPLSSRIQLAMADEYRGEEYGKKMGGLGSTSAKFSTFTGGRSVGLTESGSKIDVTGGRIDTKLAKESGYARNTGLLNKMATFTGDCNSDITSSGNDVDFMSATSEIHHGKALESSGIKTDYGHVKSFVGDRVSEHKLAGSRIGLDVSANNLKKFSSKLGKEEQGEVMEHGEMLRERPQRILERVKLPMEVEELGWTPRVERY